MADTSNYSIEERLVGSVWVHVGQQMGQTMSQVMAAFRERFNLSKPTGYVMHQQFNIQRLYVLPTLYLCVLYLFVNKQRLVPLTA